MALRSISGGTGKVRHPGRLGSGAGGGAPPQVEDTWDPATKGSAVVLSNGNLTANVATFGNMVFSITSKTTGKWYAEILIGTQQSFASTVVGLARVGISGNSNYAINSSSIVMRSTNATGAVTCASGATPVADGTLNNGDVLGIAYDCSTGLCQFYRNGVISSSGTTTPGSGMRIAAAQQWNPENRFFTIRTTTTTFSYSPPSGFLPWGSA